MWTPILVSYGAGLAITAWSLLRMRMFPRDHLLNAGCILLWPLYWAVFLVTLARNRTR
jgi:hypothetical protein